MPLASPATPARNRRARTASQPHLAWVFALQGADQNLSAFSIARLNVARIPRDSGEKSPCATCIPAASGLGFRSPGCGPKPVRFFNRPSECRSHPPRLRQETAVRELRPTRIWLGFSPLQGADQNLSAFSIVRLNAARIPPRLRRETAVRE